MAPSLTTEGQTDARAQPALGNAWALQRRWSKAEVGTLGRLLGGGGIGRRLYEVVGTGGAAFLAQETHRKAVSSWMGMRKAAGP